MMYDDGSALVGRADQEHPVVHFVEVRIHADQVALYVFSRDHRVLRVTLDGAVGLESERRTRSLPSERRNSVWKAKEQALASPNRHIVAGKL